MSVIVYRIRVLDVENYRYINVFKEIIKQYNQKIQSSVKETSYDIYHEYKKPDEEYFYTDQYVRMVIMLVERKF